MNAREELAWMIHRACGCGPHLEDPTGPDCPPDREDWDGADAIVAWLAARDEVIRAEMREAVVHVTEIRLRLDAAWQVCDVGVYPIVGSLEATLADVANRLEAELDRTGATDRTKDVTRTLGDGLLRKVQVNQVHRGGESFFRHTVMEASNQWLDGPRTAKEKP